MPSVRDSRWKYSSLSSHPPSQAHACSLLRLASICPHAAASCTPRLCFCLQVAEAALDAFESDSRLGCAALDLLPKALSLLQAAGGALDVPREDGDGAVNCEVSVSGAIFGC